MQPQVCVFSIGLTSQIIARTIEKNQFRSTFLFHEELLNEQSDIQDVLEKGEVLLSSGRNAEILRLKSDKPVITIQSSVYDIIMAAREAEKFDPKPTLIIYRNDYVVPHLTNILDRMNMRVLYYDRADEEVERQILDLKENGQHCVIGSGVVCRYAEKNGLKGIYLFPQETVRQTLETASDLADRLFTIHETNARLRTIADYSSQGILFVDQEQRIFHCNTLARSYLTTASDRMINQQLGRYFDHRDIEDMYGSLQPTQRYRSIRGNKYVINAVPMCEKGNLSGLLIYIDDVNIIHKTDRFIRREVKEEEAFLAHFTFADYHTSSPRFEAVLTAARRFANTTEPVIILGGTGTGKELLAQSIHNASSRSDNAFVAVNCAAIPENLFESEMFGYTEGAFTGAKKGGKPGYLELAHTGTIFLDEIAELDLAQQSKLLRVIQEKKLLKVGGIRPVPFDVRIIAATNQDLWRQVMAGKFRSDLYYRLNVLEIEVPALRERPEDIVLLFRGFLDELAPEIWQRLEPYHQTIGERLNAYAWPGNVRELENFSHLLVAMWREDQEHIDRIRMFNQLMDQRQNRYRMTSPQISDSLASPQAVDSGRTDRRDDVEREIDGKRADRFHNAVTRTDERDRILDALRASANNISEAAKRLGCHRSTLWRKMKKFNLS